MKRLRRLGLGGRVRAEGVVVAGACAESVTALASTVKPLNSPSPPPQIRPPPLVCVVGPPLLPDPELVLPLVPLETGTPEPELVLELEPLVPVVTGAAVAVPVVLPLEAVLTGALKWAEEEQQPALRSVPARRHSSAARSRPPDASASRAWCDGSPSCGPWASGPQLSWWSPGLRSSWLHSHRARRVRALRPQRR